MKKDPTLLAILTINDIDGMSRDEKLQLKSWLSHWSKMIDDIEHGEVTKVFRARCFRYGKK
jgi:hypothetical protein